MINCTGIDARGNHGKGQGNVFDYMLATEGMAVDQATAYYANDPTDAQQNTRWGGKLAEALGVAGKAVVKEDMEQLGKGFALDGTALCRNAGAEPRRVIKRDGQGQVRLDDEGKPMEAWEGGHRVGFDLTISAPGDVSVAFALADDPERLAILAAHRRSCDVAMAYLQSKVETRRGQGGKEAMDVEGLVWTAADHFANRNLESDLHTHHLVYGVTKGVDGKWGTFDSIELYNHQHAADHLYKAQLYAEMGKLGYGIDRERCQDINGQEGGETQARIAGIPEELVSLLKTRRQEVLDYVDAHPGASHSDACKATRRKKHEPPFPELVADWKTAIDRVSKEHPGLVRTTDELKALPGNAHKVEAASFEDVLKRIHENEALFGERDVVKALGMEFVGQKDAGEVLEAVRAFTEQPGLVRVQAERLHDDDRGVRPARRHREDRFAADWMVGWEADLIRRAQARQSEDALKVPAATVDREMSAFEAKNGFRLSDEQRESVRHLTVGTGGVGVVSGLAGTGKTTVAAVYKQCFEAEGRRLFGVAVSNKAAMKLEEESGMPCMSVAKLLAELKKGKVAFQANDVVVLDEAGMVATGDTLKLMKLCQAARCKLILQGDSDQLQPIAAGSGFALAKQAIGDRKLSEIRRQKHAPDRAIAESYYERDDQGRVKDVRRGDRSRAQALGMGARIVAGLQARGCIDDFGHASHALKAAVDDYLASPRPLSEKLLLAHSRAEVAALNEAVRAGLKKTGALDGPDVTFRSRIGDRWQDLSLAKRDRVMFTATNEDLGVVNGTEGVVESIREGKKGGYDLVIRVEASNPKEDGRVLRFNTAEHNALTHRYGMTIHKAQGQGKPEIYHLATNLGMLDQQSALVAFTRLTSGHYRMYTTDEVRERLAERLGMERHKETALDAGLSKQQAPSQSAFVDGIDALLKKLSSKAVADASQRQRGASYSL